MSASGSAIRTLLIATRNRHKVEEIASFLGGGIRCLAATDLGPGWGTPPDVHEDAPTFAGNAAKKCLSLARWVSSQSDARGGGLPWPGVAVLADDSGLEVDFLDGAPGVHSARFASLDTPGATGNAPDADNNAKLLSLLRGVVPELRTARFRCSLALMRIPFGEANPLPVAVDGTCEGRILEEGRGGAGFGYDPLFQPNGETLSFAELGSEAKNRISHRARALEALRQHLL